MMKHCLTIAGSDSCGGAGIQADLKAFSANYVYGMSVITAVTAQNTQGVFSVQDIDDEIIKNQIDAIFTDIRQYKPTNLIIDPVMISKSGFSLLKPESKKTLIKNLLPLADLITPNIPEAEEILKEIGSSIINIKTKEDMCDACKELIKLGCKNVLLKGGHLYGEAIDVLFNGEEFHYFTSERIDTKNTHGTGCTLSSTITANLARGLSMEEAISEAKRYITVAIKHSLDIGKGVGPTNHFYELYKKSGVIE